MLVKVGFTFFWSGRSHEEAGVSFDVKPHLISKFTNLSKGINDRLWSSPSFVTFISAYAPAMTNREEIKDKFYDDVVNTIENIPKEERFPRRL